VPGERFRHSKISQTPLHEGKPCVLKKEEREDNCTLKPCPVDCSYGEWSNWICHATCENRFGNQSRSRPTTQPMHGGRNCTDVNSTEWKNCTADEYECTLEAVKDLKPPFLLVGICSGVALLALVLFIGIWDGSHASTWCRSLQRRQAYSDCSHTSRSVSVARSRSTVGSRSSVRSKNSGQSRNSLGSRTSVTSALSRTSAKSVNIEP